MIVVMVVCMLGCRFVSIHVCMCPHVHLYFCMCVHVCMYVSMFVYILCVTLCKYMSLYPVDVSEAKVCDYICHTCTLPLICAQQVTEVN